MPGILDHLFSRRTKKKAPVPSEATGGGATIRIPSARGTSRPPSPDSLQEGQQRPSLVKENLSGASGLGVRGSGVVTGTPSALTPPASRGSNPLRGEIPAPLSAQSQIPSVRQRGSEERTILSSRTAAVGEAHEYLTKLQDKINKLAEEFATGAVNRLQFQELYTHYQREKQAVETWMENAAGSEDWHAAALEGRSILIRRKHTAHVLGYAIYENETGMPLRTIGKFDMDPEMFVPMLSSYRSATKEIFGAGMRSTQIEGGAWLCFVAGEFTTLMALFSNEPAGKQLQTLDEIHRLFERANRYLLRRQPVDAEALVLPHMFYLEEAH